MGMGGMEILVILLVAFILLGPAKMIEASRSLGKLVGQMRRMADQIPHVDLKELDNELSVDDEKTVKASSPPPCGCCLVLINRGWTNVKVYT